MWMINITTYLKMDENANHSILWRAWRTWSQKSVSSSETPPARVTINMRATMMDKIKYSIYCFTIFKLISWTLWSQQNFLFSLIKTQGISKLYFMWKLKLKWWNTTTSERKEYLMFIRSYVVCCSLPFPSLRCTQGRLDVISMWIWPMASWLFTSWSTRICTSYRDGHASEISVAVGPAAEVILLKHQMNFVPFNKSLSYLLTCYFVYLNRPWYWVVWKSVCLTSFVKELCNGTKPFNCFILKFIVSEY